VFSATVAAFLVDSYKYLKPDSTDVSARLLEQVTQQLAAISNGERVTAQALDAFKTPRYAIHVNILWFFSLCLALSAGLGATLVQQWLRRYNRLAQRAEAPPRHRVRIRTFLFGGMRSFHIRWFVENISLMLHAAIFLFFAGLVEFLFAFNDEVAEVILVVVGILSAIYIILTGLPIIFRHCPFQTPLTSVLWYFIHGVAVGVLFLFRCSWHVRTRSEKLSKHTYQSFDNYLLGYVKHKSKLDKSALWSTLGLCRDDREVETFLEAIPGYLQADNDKGSPIDNHNGSRVDDIGSLLRPQQCELELSLSLGHRIAHVLASCINGNGRMEEASRRHRAITCSRAVSAISKAFLSLDPPMSVTLELPKTATSRLQLLSRDHDLQIASAALSASAILERALLEQLSDSTRKRDVVRSRMTAAVLADVIGENDPGSRRNSTGATAAADGNQSVDGRLTAVTEFLSGILLLIETSWKPYRAELDEIESTLRALCRDLDGSNYSVTEQEYFARVLGDAWSAELSDGSTGGCYTFHD
jgi:hypothetical protein